MGNASCCSASRDDPAADEVGASGAPVPGFPPNGYGLFQVAGNAWEWCADWFSPDYHVYGPRDNPTGPPDGDARVIRGGSYLCHRPYCNRYRVAARTARHARQLDGQPRVRVRV